MKISRKELIADLLQRTKKSTEVVKGFKLLSVEQLNFREDPKRWSILECVEHLNLYGDYYLPEIERRMLNQIQNPGATIFKSGIIGNYFANLMQVKNGKMTRMQSPADKNPSNSDLAVTTLDRFLKQQERLKSLLLQAENTDLTRTRASISLTRYIKLRLGDTFRFFIYHIERHICQAENVLARQHEILLRK